MHKVACAFVHSCIPVLLLALLWAAPAYADVDDYLGKPVASVRLLIEGKETTDSAFVQLVQTRTGLPLSMADVRESVIHLFSLGRFDDVRVEATPSGTGVALVYAMSPVHPVTRIEFDGKTTAPGIDVSALRRAVVDRYGTSPLLSRATDMTRTVRDAIVERGYLRPDVKVRADLHHAHDVATLVFTIDPGDRTVIGAIEIDGPSGVPVKDFLGQLGLAKGTPYQQDALAVRIDRYVENRRSDGYYEARVVPVVAFADEGLVANLTLTVAPGARARIVFTGDSPPPDRRADLVPIGREGSVDEDFQEDSSNRIGDFLRAQGYRDAKVIHKREMQNGELVLTFDVHKGPQYRVRQVEVSGNASLTLEELQPTLRLHEGQPFSEARLDADIAAIEDIYHRLGFAAAKAQAAIEAETFATGSSDASVSVRIEIREGVRTLVGTVQIVGNQDIPAAPLQQRLGLQPGRPYFDPQLRVDRDTIQLEYANLGYQNATVDASPNFTPDRTQANPVFTVREGPRLFVDHVLIVGNLRTSTETIERELQLSSGAPFGLAAVDESRRRLAALGLFRRITITQLRHGEETKRDLLVAVEEAPATTVGIGGGFEVRLRVISSSENAGAATEKLEFAPRASFELGRRNLFGKNRSATLFTSVSLHPKDSPLLAGQPNASTDSTFGFTEYRVIGTFREPRLFRTTADATLTGAFEQQLRSSFAFERRSANAELSRRVTRDLRATGSYQIQQTRVFNSFVEPDDQLLVDRLFPQVRLSSFSSTASLDRRDDVIEPSQGHYVSVSGQLAARAIGSEVGFLKTFMTAEAFRIAPRTRRLVLAGRAVLGLANPFARTVTSTGSLGQPTVQTVEDLPASERFFAGGDTTVRGYALDTLGTSQTKDKDGFPIGGSGLVIFNAEARIPVWRGLGVVGFFDTGNVFAHVTDIDLTELRGAVGFGLRYRSPVGPIRIDLGFKLHRDEIAPGVREGLTALHISLGQAF